MTYGFEIEGNFLAELKQKLGDKYCYKTDGSVSVSDNERKILKRNYVFADFIVDSNSNYKSEITSPVFKNKTQLLKALKRFEYMKNWIANTTCGIHIHIGFKNDELKKLDIADTMTINRLQQYAKNNLCEHIKTRLNCNTFCRPYDTSNFNNVFYDYKNKTKYKFMKNHESGTYEFRFFSACEHKDKNTKDFFNYLNNLLKDYRFHRHTKGIIRNDKILKIELNENIKQKQKEFIKINDKLDLPIRELKLNYNMASDTIGNNSFSEPSVKRDYFYDTYPAYYYNKPYMPIPKPKRLPSLTEKLRCFGFHRDCECDNCYRRSENDEGCGQENCEHCY